MICHLIKVATGFIFALKSHNAAFFHALASCSRYGLECCFMGFIYTLAHLE